MSDIQDAINRLVRIRRKRPLTRSVRPPVLGSSGRASSPSQESAETFTSRLIGRLFGTDNPGGFPAEPGSSYTNPTSGWTHATEGDSSVLQVGNCYYSGGNGVTISWHWGPGDGTAFSNCQKYCRDLTEFNRGIAHPDSGNIYNNSSLLLRHPFYFFENPPGTFPSRDTLRCVGACLSGSWIVAAFTLSPPQYVEFYWYPVIIGADQTLTLPAGSDWWGPGGAGTAGYRISEWGWTQQFLANSTGTSMVSITESASPRRVCRITITPDGTDPVANPPGITHAFENFEQQSFADFSVDYTVAEDDQSVTCQSSGHNGNSTTVVPTTYSLSGNQCKAGGAPGEKELWETCDFLHNVHSVSNSSDIRKRYKHADTAYSLNSSTTKLLVAIDFDPQDVEVIATLNFTLTFDLSWKFEQKSETFWGGGGVATSSLDASTVPIVVDCNGQQTPVDIANVSLIPNSAVWTETRNDESSQVLEVDGSLNFRADLQLNGVSRLDLGIVDDLYKSRSKNTDTSPGSGNGTRTFVTTRQPTHNSGSGGEPCTGADYGTGAFISPGDTTQPSSSGDFQVCGGVPMPEVPDIPTLQGPWGMTGEGSRLTRFFRALTFMDITADMFVYQERKGEGLERYTPMELFTWGVKDQTGQQPPDQEFADLIIGVEKKASVNSADPTGTYQYVYSVPLSAAAKPTGSYLLEFDPWEFLSIGGRFKAADDGALFGGENFSGCSIFDTNELLVSAHQPLEMTDDQDASVELRFATLCNPTGDPFGLAGVSDSGPLVGNVSKI